MKAEGYAKRRQPLGDWPIEIETYQARRRLLLHDQQRRPRRALRARRGADARRGRAARRSRRRKSTSSRPADLRRADRTRSTYLCCSASRGFVYLFHSVSVFPRNKRKRPQHVRELGGARLIQLRDAAPAAVSTRCDRRGATTGARCAATSRVDRGESAARRNRQPLDDGRS